MKLSHQVIEAYFPIGAQVGIEYSSIIVDGQEYERMTFIGVDNGQVEFWDKFGKSYTFSSLCQKIELKK